MTEKSLQGPIYLTYTCRPDPTVNLFSFDTIDVFWRSSVCFVDGSFMFIIGLDGYTEYQQRCVFTPITEQVQCHIVNYLSRRHRMGKIGECRSELLLSFEPWKDLLRYLWDKNQGQVSQTFAVYRSPAILPANDAADPPLIQTCQFRL